MKKTLITLLVSTLLLATLPLIGNKLIEETLNTKLQHLEANGIEVQKSEVENSYLNTKRHFEFYVKDMDKFLKYLENYSAQQIPPYIDALLDGVKVGSDLEYSNLFFLKALSVEIYPLELSKEMQESIKEEDLGLYTHIENFLQNKGILYHIDYDIVSEDFDGYIKDIKESYTLADSTKILFELSTAVYHGNGKLVAPNSLISNIALVALRISKDTETLVLNMNNFHTSSNFESLSSYVSRAQLQNLELNSTSVNDNIDIDLSGLDFHVSSSIQDVKANLITKSSIKSLALRSLNSSFNANDLNFDLSLLEMDKDAFETLAILSAKAKYANYTQLQEEMGESLISLVSHGLEVNVNDFSMNDIVLDKESFGAISLQSMTNLKEDKNLANTIRYLPLLALKNVDTDLKLKFSKKIFTELLEYFPVLSVIRSYAKESADNLIYEIKFHDQSLSVNGKAV